MASTGGGNGQPSLQVDGVTVRFGGLVALDEVSFDVGQREVVGIIGPNGAGKTTLFNLITGELRPDGGSVSLFDRDITRVPSRRRFHLGIARTYQIITLFPGETLLRNVTLALLGRSRRRWNPFVRLERQGWRGDALDLEQREVAPLVGRDHGGDFVLEILADELRVAARGSVNDVKVRGDDVRAHEEAGAEPDRLVGPVLHQEEHD